MPPSRGAEAGVPAVAELLAFLIYDLLLRHQGGSPVGEKRIGRRNQNESLKAGPSFKSVIDMRGDSIHLEYVRSGQLNCAMIETLECVSHGAQHKILESDDAKLNDTLQEDTPVPSTDGCGQYQSAGSRRVSSPEIRCKHQELVNIRRPET